MSQPLRYFIVFGSPAIGQRVLAFDAWEEQWGEQKVHVEGRKGSQIVQATVRIK